MLTRDLVEGTIRSLWAHRLRSALSILGIVIGIGSFSIMYSVGEGARLAAIRIIQELGSDILEVSSMDSFFHVPGQRKQDITVKDVYDIKRDCPSVLEVAPESTSQIDIVLNGQKKVYKVIGVTTTFEKMFKLETTSGRLISDFDMESGNLVCLLGAQAADRIFPQGNALESYVTVKGYRLKVVGVLKELERMTLGTFDLSQNIIAPFSVVRRLCNSTKVNNFFVFAQDTHGAIAEIAKFSQIRYDNASFLRVKSQRLLLQTQQKYMQIFQYVLWAIGSISLLVGGIGIMNIMLVSVTERSREIGVRRAIGATKTEIKLQFLCESVSLCVFGALGGTLLGYIGSKVVSYTFGFTPVFSVILLVVVLGISTILGVIFGTYPASRAAKQNPTVVLRYE
jgi:putative ABC transport system permease protein